MNDLLNERPPFSAARLPLVLVVMAIISLSLAGLSCGKTQSMVTANEARVSFDEVGETVYLRARSWGLGGNHQEIIIATSPVSNDTEKYDKDRQLVYRDSTELFYKKIGTDTLEIRVDSRADTPPNFSTNIRVVQSVFKSLDEQREFASNYANLGFGRIGVYVQQ